MYESGGTLQKWNLLSTALEEYDTVKVHYFHLMRNIE